MSAPFDIRYELEGWEIFVARLTVTPGHDAELADLRARVAERVRDRLDLKTLATHPTVSALRRLFRAAGTDPTRYRPSSEALLRRLLKNQEMPAISPLVDLNNCLSAELAVPCCVMAEGTFAPPLVLRAGREGEAYDSLRGPFKLTGRPVLVDDDGPLDAPITGSQRVKVQPDSPGAWLAAYLPAGVVSIAEARQVLDELLRQAPVATVAVDL
ncbi:MAG: phenylalanine--tRNA ligase beta subunit-related protein [Acidobacteriota bacterium]